jgi:hypothetical protein
VWQLGYVLLMHADFFVVRLSQAAAAAASLEVSEGPDVSAAAADGIGSFGASHLDSLALLGMLAA